MEKVKFKLTDEQAEQVSKLLDEFEKSFYDQKPGSVIAQIERVYHNFGSDVYVTAKFINAEKTKKVQIATGVKVE